jgi:hypothetical protein
VDKEASAFNRRHICHVKSECQAKWVTLFRKVLRKNSIHAAQTNSSELCTEVPGIFVTKTILYKMIVITIGFCELFMRQTSQEYREKRKAGILSNYLGLLYPFFGL